jgi:hypothetical protein
VLRGAVRAANAASVQGPGLCPGNVRVLWENRLLSTAQALVDERRLAITSLEGAFTLDLVDARLRV